MPALLGSGGGLCAYFYLGLCAGSVYRVLFEQAEKEKEAMKLEPVDVLVCINNEQDPYSRLMRLALGSPYTHVMMFYWTPLATMPPLFYEAIPTKGATFTNAYDYIGRTVMVMRLREAYNDLFKPIILHNALEIAISSQTRYDFACVPGFILPRLISEKLGLPLPLKYHRDPFMVCSEAVAEPFWRANLEVLPRDVVPLPGDFTTAYYYFEYITIGNIAEDWF
jgi:hypothetical protein